jgi:erythronate-4-phosphate dehydrogenase
LKIIIDSYIPYIKGALENVAEIEYLSYKEITAETVANADALIVRTRTRCDEHLLKYSSVKFIASATIGYDHIDAEYCKKNQITWTNAPGCNALSVAQYMASVFSLLATKNDKKLDNLTIGIVGVGAVGSKIALTAEGFGMRVLLNDPPRAKREGEKSFVTLEEICQQADIISFHTLLNMSGEDKTWHLANDYFFQNLHKKPVIINASRGEVIDTNALLNAIKTGKVSDVILDCWEEEPKINRELLEHSFLATPHIAGYSADGKANAAMQSVQALSKFFNLGLDHWKVKKNALAHELELTDSVFDFFLSTYDISADNETLKKNPDNFELQRSNYPYRREPKAYLEMMSPSLRKKMETQFGVFFQ